MKISFCVITYNRISDLKKAIYSILSLNGLDSIEYELLVSDDSKDNITKDFVHSLSINNKNIKYLRNKTHGQFNNLNNVTNHAKYDWIVFLHDDDILGKDYLGKILEVREKVEKEDIDILWGARNLIDKEDLKFNTLLGSKSSLGDFVEVNSKEFLYQMLGEHDYTYRGKVIFPMVTGIMVRAELAKRVMFDTSFEVNADGLFLWKIFFHSNKSLFINAPIVNYRWVDNSERAKPSEQGIVYREMKGILLAMIAYMESELGKKNMQSAKKQFMNSFYFNAANIDSPITWVSLRYKGGYIKRVRIVLHIIFDIIKNYPKVLIKPSLYLCTVVCFLPQSVLKFFYRYYIKRII